MRIVIADDAVALRGVLRRILEAAGHDVVGEAVDDATALAAVLELRPDVVILDGRLPPAGAASVIASLRGAHAPLAVYVIAALREGGIVQAAAAAGACGALLRPLQATQITAVLNNTAG